MNIKEVLQLLKDRKYSKDYPAYKQMVGSSVGTLTDMGSIAGGALQLASNVPGQAPNIGQSALGGALSGMAAGPIGMIGGAFAGGLTALKGSQDYLAQMERNQQASMMGKSVMPAAYMEEGGPTDFTEVQTELGEVISMPTGELVDVNAKKLHKDEDKKTITDVMPGGSFVFSNKHKINTEKLSDEDDVVMTMPGVYSEEGNIEHFTWKLSDMLGKGEFTFAEAVKKIREKIPTEEDIKDIFTTQANSMNIETRLPYISRLMELQEKLKREYKEGETYDVSEDEAKELAEQGYSFEIED